MNKIRIFISFIISHYNTSAPALKVFYLSSFSGICSFLFFITFNFIKLEYQKLTFRSFQNDVYGIFVAPFSDDTDELRIQKSILLGLKDNFKKLEINNADVKMIPAELWKPFSNHNEARNFGEKYKAQIVIWGDVVVSGVKPRLTVVKSKSEATVVINKDTDILKDTLSSESLESISDIDFPPLTAEPTSVVSFVTGLRYFDEGEYAKAVDYFNKSIPQESTPYLDLSVIYF